MEKQADTEQQVVDRFDYAQYKSSVGINQEYTHTLPFIKIQSRLPSAMILAYFGYREEVITVMLSLSHKTRAYFFNE